MVTMKIFVFEPHNRNRFLIGNLLKMSVGIRKKDSINRIKLVGRLHSHLVSIVDELNFCYSIQVIFFFKSMFMFYQYHRTNMRIFDETKKQMMINVGLTFITALLTLYSMFRYTLQQNDFFLHLFRMHVSFLVYCLIALILIIYISNALTNEV